MLLRMGGGAVCNLADRESAGGMRAPGAPVVVAVVREEGVAADSGRAWVCCLVEREAPLAHVANHWARRSHSPVDQVCRARMVPADNLYMYAKINTRPRPFSAVAREAPGRRPRGRGETAAVSVFGR